MGSRSIARCSASSCTTRHLLKPRSDEMKQVYAGEALESVLAAAQRPPSNEDSRTDGWALLGRSRRSFVTLATSAMAGREKTGSPTRYRGEPRLSSFRGKANTAISRMYESACSTGADSRRASRAASENDGVHPPYLGC